MRVNISSCLLLFVCNVTAEIIHRVITEKETVSLSCPHPETKVTWSRWTDRGKEDVLTLDGDRDIRHNDPGRRYNSIADKSLHIHKAAVSDSGTYLCNNERAAELTVIPSGTNIQDVTERTSLTLSCPPGVGGPYGPTWTRSFAGKLQQVQSEVSPADRTLTITNLQPGHSGLYYCDGKPAVYLNVSKDERSDRATSKLTTTPPTPPARTKKSRKNRKHNAKKTTAAATATTATTTTAAATTATATTATTTTATTTTTTTTTTTAAATTTTTTTATTTTTTTTTTTAAAAATAWSPSASPGLWQTSVRAGSVILALITMICITVITWRKAEQKLHRGREDTQTQNEP